MLALTLALPAAACGGFFCDNVEPVVQSAERILFREEGPGDWTAFVEVQFEGSPTSFAWVVPVAAQMDLERDVGLAPAGLFDDLEAATAPRFVHAAMPMDAAADAMAGSSGCALGFADEGYGVMSFDGTMPDTSGVEVVGAAVAGPYAMELITADEAENLVNWLNLNGYAYPLSATDAMDHYIDGGFAFLGLKLQPDVAAGPIDTLTFRCGSTEPLIPLVLTSVASVPRLDITAYVLGAHRYEPANTTHLDFDWSAVSWVFDGGTDYLPLLDFEIDRAGGQAWITEYAAPAIDLFGSLSDASKEALSHGAYVTRLHTRIEPEHMTVDPVFREAPSDDEVDPVHVIGEQAQAAGAGFLGALWLAAVGWRRRRG